MIHASHYAFIMHFDSSFIQMFIKIFKYDNFSKIEQRSKVKVEVKTQLFIFFMRLQLKCVQKTLTLSHYK